MITASTDIQYLKGVGEKRAVVLKKKGIDTVGALLRFYPRAYLDWTDITPIEKGEFFRNICVKARVLNAPEESVKRRGMTVYSFFAADSSGKMQVSLFNQKYLAQKLKPGCEYLFYGKLSGNFVYRQMSAPRIAEISDLAIEPVYKSGYDITSSTIKKLVKNAISSVKVPEVLSAEVRERNGLCEINFAIENIHFPKNEKALKAAKKRLVFEELFVLQAGLAFLKKRTRKSTGCIIQNGYYEGDAGTSWALMTEGAAQFGVYGEEMGLSEEAVFSSLENGNPIICSMSPGDFTTTGHFIVLVGIEDGKIRVNDPNSVKRSEKLWDYETLYPQISNLWVYTAG